jgi:phosphinothricin acetyltransferase
LLTVLITRCTEIGKRQLIAVIGDSANLAASEVHGACGFRAVGTFAAIGFKHGRWVDSVLMQRPLGAGADSLPG